MPGLVDDLIDIVPGIKLQDEDSGLIYLVDEPVLIDSCPESGRVAFAFLISKFVEERAATLAFKYMDFR